MVRYFQNAWLDKISLLWSQSLTFWYPILPDSCTGIFFQLVPTTNSLAVASNKSSKLQSLLVYTSLKFTAASPNLNFPFSILPVPLLIPTPSAAQANIVINLILHWGLAFHLYTLHVWLQNNAEIFLVLMSYIYFFILLTLVQFKLLSFS